jgi:hypothetical protein
MASGSQELAVRHSSSLAALDDFDAIIQGEKAAEKIVSDPAVVQREIVAQILSAQSDDELQIGKATPWQELLGVPVEIHSFRWRESSYDEGSPLFVVVDGFRMDNGEKVVLTTGGLNVLAQLSNMARREALPAIWKLEVSEKQTARGFQPLWLVKATAAEEALARSMADESNPLDEPDEK